MRGIPKAALVKDLDRVQASLEDVVKHVDEVLVLLERLESYNSIGSQVAIVRQG